MDRALGQSGRPAGVLDPALRVRADRRRAGPAVVAVDQPGQQVPAGRHGVGGGRDRQRDLDVREDRVAALCVVGVEHQAARSGVADHVAVVLEGEAHVERHDGQARPQRAVHDLQQRGRVGQQDRDTVAWRQPAREQRAAGRADAAEELPIGQALSDRDERELGRVAVAVGVDRAAVGPVDHRATSVSADRCARMRRLRSATNGIASGPGK